MNEPLSVVINGTKYKAAFAIEGSDCVSEYKTSDKMTCADGL